MADLRSKILKVLSTAGKKGISRRKLVKTIAPGARGGRAEVHSVLDSLIASGMVELVKGRIARLAGSGARITGVLKVNKRHGFGFVSVEHGRDVFVGPDDFGEALDGDEVELSLLPRGRGARGPRGKVSKVLERSRRTVIGEVFRAGTGLFVIPEDPRLHRDFLLEQGTKVEPGRVVCCSITKYPGRGGEPGLARVDKVLGVQGQPGIEIEKIVAQAGLETEFSSRAEAEASSAAAGFEANSPEYRDLTDVAFVTIDPEDARDLDDAIAYHRGSILVAIADVAAFVKPGSALDDEARVRGCSVYFPDRCVPMLPSALTGDACSLLPGRVRPAVVVSMDSNGAGKDLFLASIESRAKLSYVRAANILDGAESEAFTGCKEMLGKLSRVAQGLKRSRMKRGALDLDMAEPRVLLGPDGMPVDVVRSLRLKSHVIVEELMIAANEAVATLLMELDVKTLFRVHEEPEPEAMAVLKRLASARGLPVPEDGSPKSLAAFLKSLHGRREERYLKARLLRALAKARYCETNLGHHGLASEGYLHFTSPIRRYPDLVVHRQVREYIRQGSAGDIADAADLAMACSTAERNAEEAEREAVDAYRAMLLSGMLGEVMPGAVSWIQPNGLFVELDSPFAEVFVPLSRLPRGLEVDESGTRLKQRGGGWAVTIGDRVHVLIEGASVARRMVQGSIHKLLGRSS